MDAILAELIEEVTDILRDSNDSPMAIEEEE